MQNCCIEKSNILVLLLTGHGLLKCWAHMTVTLELYVNQSLLSMESLYFQLCHWWLVGFALCLLARIFKVRLFSETPVFKVQTIHALSKLNLLLVVDTKKYLWKNALTERNIVLNIDYAFFVMNFLPFLWICLLFYLLFI